MRARSFALAAALACLVFALSASAHDFSPGVLALVESAPGRFDMAWTEPVDSVGAPAGVRVVFPPACRLEAAEVDCGAAGLTGEIAFEGMHSPRMQVVVSVRRLDGATEEQVVTGAAPRIELRAASGSVAVWIRLGVEHILGGIDHIAFVLGLLLLRRGQRRGATEWLDRGLIATITAFTLAHSLTLALATLGWLRLARAPVEATIAASVLLVAREAASSSTSEPPTLARRFPWLVALLFGLVHGLGFAGALRDLGLPGASVPRALLGFNLGVELGQLAVVAFVLGLVRLLRGPLARLPWSRTAACYALGSAAAFWFIARGFELLSR